MTFPVQSQKVPNPVSKSLILVVTYVDPSTRNHKLTQSTNVFFKHSYDIFNTGCVIATATFGSELAPQVQFLRNFRDNSILKTYAGSSFMVAFNTWYYSFSPAVATYLINHWVERTIMKGLLYPLIGILILAQATFTVVGSYPELAVLLSGLLASSLIGALYLGLPLSFIRTRVRHPKRIVSQARIVRLLTGTLLGGVIVLVIGELTKVTALMIASSSLVVLSSLFLSAAIVSSALAKKLRYDLR